MYIGNTILQQPSVLCAMTSPFLLERTKSLSYVSDPESLLSDEITWNLEILVLTYDSCSKLTISI